MLTAGSMNSPRSPTDLLDTLGASSLMLATLYPRPFSSDDWLFELKYDGYRALAVKQGSQVRLLSRLGNDLAPQFAEVVDALAGLEGDFALDGELTVTDAYGRADFLRLATRAKTTSKRSLAHARRTHPASLWAFDVLARDAIDVRGEPLIERKQVLAELLQGATGPVLPVTYIEAHGEALFTQVAALRQEGIMAKRMASRYRAGRSDDWRKLKLKAYSRKLAVAPL